MWTYFSCNSVDSWPSGPWIQQGLRHMQPHQSDEKKKKEYHFVNALYKLLFKVSSDQTVKVPAERLVAEIPELLIAWGEQQPERLFQRENPFQWPSVFIQIKSRIVAPQTFRIQPHGCKMTSTAHFYMTLKFILHKIDPENLILDSKVLDINTIFTW